MLLLFETPGIIVIFRDEPAITKIQYASKRTDLEAIDLLNFTRIVVAGDILREGIYG